MNKTELLDRCARSGEERTLLARVLDKLELAQNRGVPAHTPFLTPGEQASAADLLAAWGNPRYTAFGGYEGSERNILYFPPDWQEPKDALSDPEGPLAALEGTFPNGASLTHRDILGSLMGLGITREKLGDILILEGKCQVVALREALPILLSQWESAGRWKAVSYTHL
ncbi:YlmH/Sll1252 family protein, partial [Pseudoflavonifractor capillosus]|uniref:YlmH/Sll1252 family protein n=1 Tax=Pseudoflavonifractor capillosus TaxID=106588 RepID=UPI001E0D7A85|nr:RNA-binding protein [Pseudoflavonifractor capillosus]